MENIHLEQDFENHIRKEILYPILQNYPELQLFNFKKAVDILIAKNGEAPQLFFIEIKYHKKNHGRLGFGQGKGGGFQPEVLRNKSDYFEKNMRWILGTEESENYWFVNNELLRKYISGGAIGEKHNNIQSKFFKEVEPIDKISLKEKINAWLVN